MKNLFITVSGKLIVSVGLILIITATQAQSAVAGLSPKDDSSIVKYLGAQDDLLLFQVAYKNSGGAAFSLTVKDQDGTELYKNACSGKNFSKQFRLPKDKSRIIFIIRANKETSIVKTFEINVNSHYIQDVAIKKLD